MHEAHNWHPALLLYLLACASTKWIQAPRTSSDHKAWPKGSTCSGLWQCSKGSTRHDLAGHRGRYSQGRHFVLEKPFIVRTLTEWMLGLRLLSLLQARTGRPESLSSRSRFSAGHADHCMTSRANLNLDRARA